jgi:hypothetical protein
MDNYVKDLIQIGKTTGFIPEGRANEKAFSIGSQLFAQGGFSLMIQVHSAIAEALGQLAAHDLSAAWHGVGKSGLSSGWQH